MAIVSVLRTKVMGILNVTPDSFSDGGRYDDVEAAVTRALQMVKDGADILDVGGESTRPGADIVESSQEYDRVIPVITALRAAKIDVPISIDTRRATIAHAAVQAGANIWNDVTALSFEESSLETAAQLNCPIVLMHMRGTPQTMQSAPHYDQVIQEILHYLGGRIVAACAAGVKRENIILDPGIGFGKRLEDNLDLLHGMDALHELSCPLLIGASRKSFISQLDNSDVEHRLGGSIASALWAHNMGAQIVRVHDVRATKQALMVNQAIRGRQQGRDTKEL